MTGCLAAQIGHVSPEFRIRVKTPAEAMKVFRSSGFVSGILLGTVIAMIAGCRYHPTLVEIDNLIKREVPVGSDQSQVIAFLRARNMEYTYDEKDKAIYTGFRNLPSGWLTERSIQVVFFFDKSGKLKSHTVQELSLTASD